MLLLHVRSEQKDYYEVLGVSKGASEGEIKRAYKKLALKSEPQRSLRYCFVCDVPIYY